MSLLAAAGIHGRADLERVGAVQAYLLALPVVNPLAGPRVPMM